MGIREGGGRIFYSFKGGRDQKRENHCFMASKTYFLQKQVSVGIH